MFGKKKVSIDFLEPEYALLTEQAKREGKSNSFIVNGLINLFLRLSPEVGSKIGKFCYEQYLKEKENLEKLSGFERDEAQKRMEQYEKLSAYFGYNTKAEADPGMKITFLKDGYVQYPKDWIVLQDVFGPADSCMYAGVVESRNSEKYGIPHFIFFSNTKYGKDYTDEMHTKIYDACSKAWPDFGKYFNMQVPARYTTDMEYVKKWDAAPCFGLFHIVEKGDPMYWTDSSPDYKPPFGAMIIRNSYHQ